MQAPYLPFDFGESSGTTTPSPCVHLRSYPCRRVLSRSRFSPHLGVPPNRLQFVGDCVCGISIALPLFRLTRPTRVSLTIAGSLIPFPVPVPTFSSSRRRVNWFLVLFFMSHGPRWVNTPVGFFFHERGVPGKLLFPFSTRLLFSLFESPTNDSQLGSFPPSWLQISPPPRLFYVGFSVASFSLQSCSGPADLYSLSTSRPAVSFSPFPNSWMV